MRGVRATTALVLAAASIAVGLALVAEAADATSGAWRDQVADAFDEVVTPTWPGWASAIVGIVLAVLGVAIVAAHIAPPKRGLNIMHEVSSGTDGLTHVRGRAAIAAARYEVEKIEGVVDAAPTLDKKRMRIEIRVDDRADLELVTTEAQGLLGTPFWIDLGLADFAIDIVVVHHPNPPRVR